MLRCGPGMYLLATLAVVLSLLTAVQGAQHSPVKTLAEALNRLGHPLGTLGDRHAVPYVGSRTQLGLSDADTVSRSKHVRRADDVQQSIQAIRRIVKRQQRNQGLPSWEEAATAARTLVAKMTLDEKVNMTTGISQTKCAGSTGSVPRLGVPELCLQDGPTGVRGALNVSQFPAEVTLGATWNRKLAAERAGAMAQEFHDLGVNFMFAPVSGGPLGRSPLGGRNMEGIGSDEYLTGVLSYDSVKGAQENGVVACSKHFIGYEQETSRNMHTILGQLQKPYSSNIDDKTMHQLYMWPFAEAVRAGTGMIMCSYNRVNGTQQCENDASLNGLLKGELNFQGVVVSDYGAVYSLDGSANNGMDLLMPGDALFGVLPNYFGTNGQKLKQAVQQGKVKESRIDDMVQRILTPVLRYQYADLSRYPGVKLDTDILLRPQTGINVQGDHYKVIRQIGLEANTLVKNSADARRGLPLRKADLAGGTIAVLGSDAYGSSDGAKSCTNTGMCDDLLADQGTQTDGIGSGYTFPPYVIDPLNALQTYLKNSGATIVSSRAKPIALGDDSVSHAVKLASEAKTAIVFGNARGEEGNDRKDLILRQQVDKLITKVAAVNKNTIVVLHTPGPVLVEEWIDHPNVTAVLFAFYPGQESGASLTPVLFGDVSPSGRLPFVVGKKLEDWPPNTIASTWKLDPQVDFREGTLIDWKWFDAKGIVPRFPFGFGLSYTTFSYGRLTVEKGFKADDPSSNQATHERFDKGAAQQGNSLYDVLLRLTIPVKNTGTKEGAEVAQLYISYPSSTSGEAPHVLRGFQKLNIAPGASVTATFEITRKDMSIWDTVHQQWTLPSGSFTFFAGSSASDWQYKSQVQYSF